jgi:hypothetical protein
MAICLHGEQRRECVAFRPRVDIPSRDAAADEVRAFEQFPDSESPVCNDVAAQFELVSVARATQVQFDNMAKILGSVGALHRTRSCCPSEDEPHFTARQEPRAGPHPLPGQISAA